MFDICNDKTDSQFQATLKTLFHIIKMGFIMAAIFELALTQKTDFRYYIVPPKTF